MQTAGCWKFSGKGGILSRKREGISVTQNAKKPVCEYDLPAYERYLAAQAAKGRRLTDWLEFSY